MEMWFHRWYRDDDPYAGLDDITDKNLFDSLEDAVEAVLKPELVPYDEKLHGDEHNVYPKDHRLCDDEWKGFPDKHLVRVNEKGEQVLSVVTKCGKDDTTYPFVYLLQWIRENHSFDLYDDPHPVDWRRGRGYTIHRLILSRPVVEAAMQKTTLRASIADEGAQGKKRHRSEYGLFPPLRKRKRG